jgi:hypothetical protein
MAAVLPYLRSASRHLTGFGRSDAGLRGVHIGAVFKACGESHMPLRRAQLPAIYNCTGRPSVLTGPLFVRK